MELLGNDTNETVVKFLCVTVMDMNSDVEGNPQAEVLG